MSKTPLILAMEGARHTSVVFLALCCVPFFYAGLEETLACEGTNLNEILLVLEELPSWQRMANQLDMKQATINKIKGADDPWMKLVITYCDAHSTRTTPVEHIVANISKAMREMGFRKQADTLWQKFSMGTPTTPVDTPWAPVGTRTTPIDTPTTPIDTSQTPVHALTTLWSPVVWTAVCVIIIFCLIKTTQNNKQKRSEFETKVEGLQRETADLKQRLSSEEERQGKMVNAYETQVKKLRVELDTISESLKTTEALQREGEEERKKVRKELAEGNSRTEQLKVTNSVKATPSDHEFTPSESTPSESSKLTVECDPMSKGPSSFFRGSAVYNKEFAYFTPSSLKLLYRYTFSSDEWEELLQCPCVYHNSALVFIDGALTTVGGDDGARYMKQLYTLQKTKLPPKIEWKEKYPPMNTPRNRPTIVSTSDCLFVIGGGGDGSWINIVEMFDVGKKSWCRLASLPKCFQYPSATIVCNDVHVIGLVSDVYSCSLQDLKESSKPVELQTMSRMQTWKQLPSLPVQYSTVAAILEQLVIVGGRKENSTDAVKSIHQFINGRWIKIGSMSSNRSMCLVVSSSPHEMVVVGGVDDSENVEKCSVSM